VIAFVLSVVVCALFLFAGSPSGLNYLGQFMPVSVLEIGEGLSFESRFMSIQRGVIELRDLAFFLFLIVGWLWANMVALEERRAA
jgi:ABC-2 type transport system permease protein